MPKGAPEQQQPSSDGSLDFLWLIALIVIATILIWYFGKAYIGMAILKLRSYEIAAITFLSNLWDKLTLYLPLPTINLAPLQKDLAFIQNNYGAKLEFKALAKLSTSVGKYLSYPCAVILAGLSVILYLGGSAQRFKNIFNMDRLKKLEQKIWPQITPVVGLNLINKNLSAAPWAMSSNPLLFCKQNNLLEVEIKEGRHIATLRRGAAYQILSLQLGPRWNGPEKLPLYLQALFAIFAARLNGDKKSGDAMIDQIAASARDPKFKATTLNFSGTIELLNKHKNAKQVIKTTSLHGYVTTAMASLLNASREAGVLASAEFIWLKPLDRRMWYMLNSVGRPTAVAEISGAFAHWLAEKKLGLPLVAPMIDEAVTGLDLALKEIIYKPEED